MGRLAVGPEGATFSSKGRSGKAMKLLDAFVSALTALRSHLLRSVLTMLGIVIGVGAVIAMVSIGSGMKEQVVGRIKSLGANLLVILPGNVTAGGVRLGVGQSSALTDDDARAIEREVANVQAVAPTLRGGAQVVVGGQNWSTNVQGVDLGWFVVREWDVGEGRSFSADEVTRGGQVAIIGAKIVTQLFDGADPIGQTIRIKNVPFEVIGVAAAKGQSAQGQDQDDTVFLPLVTARQRVIGTNRAKNRSVGTVYVKIAEGEDMKAAEEEIRALLRQRHRQQDGSDDDFTIRNLADIAATVESTAGTIALAAAAIAGVSLVVGGIGIMNIMLVSVTERTREIGVRMAVGARPADVLSQFLIEATTLSVIGGVIGISIGVALASLAARQAGWPLLVEPNAILLAVLSSGIVGVASGFYPAWRASRLDPVEALRTA